MTTLPTVPGFDAVVMFNPDPRLSFLRVGSAVPILPADVELMLETSPLGAIGGLPTELPLFTYAYDLSATPLPPTGAWFASHGEARAFSPSVDLNDDGVIDGADLAIVYRAWGLGGGLADVNADLVVDGADIAALYRKWTGDSSALAIPEPKSRVLCLLLGLAGPVVVRRCRSEP